MEFTLKIQAPELVEAANNLATAMRTLSASGNCVSEMIGAGVETRQSQVLQTPAPYQAMQPPQQLQMPQQPQQLQQPQQPFYLPTSIAPPAVNVPIAAYQPQAQAAAPQASVPTTVQTYTLDQLAVAGTQLMDAGRMAELQSLLAEFGVPALTALPKEHYGMFATRLRALGAKI